MGYSLPIPERRPACQRDSVNAHGGERKNEQNSNLQVGELHQGANAENLDFGLGNAYAYVVSLITFGFALVYFRVLYRRGDFEA